MAKKKATEIKKPKFTKEEVEAALQICHSEYFIQVIALMSYDPSTPDLTYVKVPVTTPDGGNYLISILHIDGPKLNLAKLEAAALEAEKENG